ncbi:hypothetical protein HRbin12_01476 [bacterium HR12]|nr:hypothetical protein HRbin12_01476 [bacterium HR12]
MPEGIVFSAHTTAPLPPKTSNRPTAAAPRQSAGVGRSPSASPRRTAHAYRSAPATRNRREAARSGGRVWFTTRIARYVVPQIT